MSLLPDEIANSKGEATPKSVLQGKYIGIYFGAHWCAPCRSFAPQLIDWFANFKKNHASKDKLEMIYVSSDKSEETCNDYHRSMGIYLLPFVHRDVKVPFLQIQVLAS
jgi:nucleoredoxin